MPVSQQDFLAPQSPVTQLQKLMRKLEHGSIEARFTDEKNEDVLSREFVEMAFQDFAIQQQNPQVMNKWIALDTKLDKSLLEYLSDVKLLIASIIQTGTAQGSLGEPMNMPEAPGSGISSEPQMNSKERELPVSREG